MVEFAFTECRLGGRRAWFACPRCTRRVASLFLSEHGILCRHCLHLTYSSANESKENRAWRRANNLWRRLGKPDPDLTVPPKPARMHHRTFQRLFLKWKQAELRALLMGWPTTRH